MEEKIVTVINEMSEYLSIAQIKRLQEVLIKAFSNKEPKRQEISILIDGTYYVVEAVNSSKKKRNYVVTAYISKKIEQ